MWSGVKLDSHTVIPISFDVPLSEMFSRHINARGVGSTRFIARYGAGAERVRRDVEYIKHGSDLQRANGYSSENRQKIIII